jgi:hypothetical protein
MEHSDSFQDAYGVFRAALKGCSYIICIDVNLNKELEETYKAKYAYR